MPSMLLSRRSKIVLSVIVVLIVLIIALVKFSGVYLNYLWFDELGHRNVYSTVFWTRFTLFFVFGALMAVILGGNMAAAYLIKPPFRPMSSEQQNLQHYVLMVEPRRKLVLAVVMIIALLSAGASAQGNWATWQLFFNGGSFGQKDPQFGRDISFYAFDYPVYRLLLSFGFAAVIFSIILSAVIHYLTGSIRLQTPGPKVTVGARRHLTILVFVFMVLKAIAYWLDRYGLVFSTRSKFTGASYTDVHSELPAKTILFWLTIVLALGVLASMWLRSVLLPGIGFVILLVLSILIGGIYPATVQHFSVKPNASDKERAYIGRNIDATRAAYGITINNGKNNGPVDLTKYTVSSAPPKTSVTTANNTVDNIRITDPNVVSPTFTNKQKITQYYGFSNKLNVDRYTDADGVEHDYIVGARELDPSNLDQSKRNWINEHTVYTHGYGFVAAEADKDITQQGATFSAGDIPTTPKTGPLAVKVPQIYYGQDMVNYSIVGAQGKKREYDATGQRVTYKGSGGVSLSNPITKLALALHYKDTNFVLNDAVSTKGAKIIYVRDPKARVEKVAPFLTVDGDPYPFVDQSTGHIMWMVDGYTTMANYPYSERQSLSDLTHTSLRKDQKDTQINYIRNSVKATVDAYTGKVTLYQWDQSDPILKAWMKTFPGLVSSKSTMPQSVLSHVRYPQDLFDVQRALLAQYHVSDPVAFYNGSSQWAVPSDPFTPSAGDQPPYYVLANAADSKTNTAPQFQLTSPMLVNNSKNLAAYISADCDPDDYGKLTVLVVDDQSAVPGPEQVANTFRTQSDIASNIKLLNGGGTESSVMHGNLLTLPLGDSFLYVEPLYASGSAFPTLQRVLVAYGDNLGFGATLSDALSDFLPGHTLGQTLGLGAGSSSSSGGGSSGGGSSGSTTAPPSSGSSSSTPPPAGGGDTEASLLAQLNTVQHELAEAKQSGDTVKQVEALQKQNELVQKLLKVEGGSSPATGGGKTSPASKPSPSK